MTTQPSETKSTPPRPATHTGLTPEQLRARKRRNIAIALAIAGFVVFFYAITVAKLGLAVLNRPL